MVKSPRVIRISGPKSSFKAGFNKKLTKEKRSETINSEIVFPVNLNPGISWK